jgi:hypothetical protein
MSSLGRCVGLLPLLGILVVGDAGCGNGGNGSSGGLGAGVAGGGTGSGSGSGTGKGGAAGNDTGTNTLAPLSEPAVNLQGGSAPAAGGLAKNGGDVHLVAKGGIALDPGAAVPAVPAAGAAPAGTMALDAAALAADVSTAASVVLEGNVTSSGGEPVRTITAGGDIYVRGTLRGADLGGARQGLTLRADGGTVYVIGTVDTGGAAGMGQAGGPLTIIAKQVVVTGKVVTAGGDGPAAGAAGAVTVTTAGSLFVSGTLNAAGGNAATAMAVTGGRGGDLKVKAGADVVLGGVVSVHGGTATSMAGDATGGDGGAVSVDADGDVTFAGTLDGRGGTALAAAAGGAVIGGAAATLKVGEAAPPKEIAVAIPMLLRGGEGAAAGGVGGTPHLEPHAGNLRLAGVLDVSGGNSGVKPGAGGNIFGNPGPDTAAGVATAGVVIAGQVISNGGSITAGATGDGADGGVIKLVVLSTAGDMILETSGQVQTDGGRSGGSGRGGGGGVMYLFTRDGRASIGGKLLARGGEAPDGGGSGGLGGFIYVFTDDNHGGTVGGALVIETTGHIDASGGDGAIGGSARSDAVPHAVATWPVRQDDEYDVERIAVLINSDGKHGTATGYIDNRGTILARGGKTGGAGGDVQYHGKMMDGNEHPTPGNVDMSGDGAGPAGDFAGE